MCNEKFFEKTEILETVEGYLLQNNPKNSCGIQV